MRRGSPRLMQNVYLLIGLVLLVAWTRTLYSLLRTKAALAASRSLLDYVLRFYALDVSNPYVSLPGFDEQRCHFCHYPINEDHHQSCIWAVLRPITSKLY
jgi:hypothetical protein